MSNRAHRRPKQQRPSRDLIRHALAVTGCTCAAGVRHVRSNYVQLVHDRDCPALGAPRVYGIEIPFKRRSKDPPT